MKKIIFATGNEGKMKEIRRILADPSLEILSLKDAGIHADIDENGKSFEENAMIKAEAICKMTGEIVLADDSGLEIDFLNKEPGIYSARYMGEDTSYHIKNANLVERLDGVPDEKRTARFVCAIAAAFPDGRRKTVRAAMEGRIGYEEKGENGFGYDPIFYLPEYGCTSAEQDQPPGKSSSHDKGRAGMKVLIVSDTHGRDENLELAVNREAPFDMLVHCGDVEGREFYIEALAECPCSIVSGNNDFFSDLPREEVIDIEENKVLVTHGHYYGVSMAFDQLADAAKQRGCNAAFFGHIHVPVLEKEDGILLVNPGRLAFPRQRGRRPSYAVLETDGNGKMNVEIRNL